MGNRLHWSILNKLNIAEVYSTPANCFQSEKSDVEWWIDVIQIGYQTILSLIVSHLIETEVIQARITKVEFPMQHSPFAECQRFTDNIHNPLELNRLPNVGAFKASSSSTSKCVDLFVFHYIKYISTTYVASFGVCVCVYEAWNLHQI